AFLNPEIVPADETVVVMVPGAGMIESADAGGIHGKNRAFHVALLRIEIFRPLRTRVIDEIQPPRAGEIADGLQSDLRRHLMIRMVLRVYLGICLPDIDLHG